MRVKYSYLEEQFANPDPILASIRELVLSTDFTLGTPLTEFEGRFAEKMGVAHAIGVNSGTDAITPKTKAILPVHWAGHPADVPQILEIANKHDLVVVEDSCQAISGEVDGKLTGTMGDAGAFSLHPLKNLNVWGDGGIIITNSDELAAKLRLIRNHGLASRDVVECWGYNSRLDTLQACVGNHLIDQFEFITNRRIENAARLDAGLASISQIRIPEREANKRYVYHLYIVEAEDRDGLLAHLHAAEIEAKIHYPQPLHLQPAAKSLGYKVGDFPVCEAQAKRIVTLPAHQHLSDEQIDFMIAKIREFYGA